MTGVLPHAGYNVSAYNSFSQIDHTPAADSFTESAALISLFLRRLRETVSLNHVKYFPVRPLHFTAALFEDLRFDKTGDGDKGDGRI